MLASAHTQATTTAPGVTLEPAIHENARRILREAESARDGHDDGAFTWTGFGIMVGWDGAFEYYRESTCTKNWEPLTREDAIAIIAQAPQHEGDLPEPAIHPVATQMVDIGLSRAADGEPTTEDDLAHFTLAEIKQHWPTARAAIHASVVRHVDDDRGFETHAQLLQRCVRKIARRLPDDFKLKQMLRSEGLQPGEIASLWPDFISALAAEFQRANLGRAH